MTPKALLRTFSRHQHQTGIVGVAFGPKQVHGKSEGNPCSIAFFVREKLPERGGRKRLKDGRHLLPKFVEHQGTAIPTDVVVVAAQQPTMNSGRSPPQIYRAGGKVSNLSITGTIGCLVGRRPGPGLFAITNQHIGLGTGTVIAFPDFNADFFFRGETTASVGLVADEEFLAPFDNPQTYVDVDCALVRIPAAQESRFTPEIPNFGRPKGIFRPDTTDTDSFTQSILGKNVYSYSWKSGSRAGSISHVYYTFSNAETGMTKIACFLVQSSDDFPPGLPGDSGKLWMTRINGENHAIGIHSGVVADSAASSQFAMVTEFSSLARYLNLQLA